MDLLVILMVVVLFYLVVMAVVYLLARLFFPTLKLSEELEEKILRLDRLQRVHHHHKKKLAHS